MADYALIGWTPEVTKLSAANFAKMDAGILDAVNNNDAGTVRPPANAANKHHIWRDLTSGVAWYCDGAEWVPVARTAQPAPRERGALTGAAGPDQVMNGPGTPSWSQAFVAANSGKVQIIEVQARKTNAVQGSLTMYLFPDDGNGKPRVGGPELGWTETVQAVSLPAAYATREFAVTNPAGGVPVVAGQRYHVVFSPDIIPAPQSVDITGVANPAELSYFSSDPWTAAWTLRPNVGIAFRALAAKVDSWRALDAAGASGLVVDYDGGVYARGRKVAGADGLTDFVQKADVPATNTQIGELFHVISAAGEPAFAAGWGATRNISNGNWEYPAFYKDPLGVVHVKGSARATAAVAADSPIFSFPPGYRPNRYELFPCTGSVKEVYIDGVAAPAGSTGGLRISTAAPINTSVQLDGISFRAGDGTQA